MTVKCIDTMGYKYLTMGKTYEVVSIDADGDYYIINDECDDLWYPKYLFKTLSEMRNETINKLLENES